MPAAVEDLSILPSPISIFHQAVFFSGLSERRAGFPAAVRGTRPIESLVRTLDTPHSAGSLARNSSARCVYTRLTQYERSTRAAARRLLIE
jgi:hypothetical protein